MRRILKHLNPLELLTEFWSQRTLIIQFTTREIQGRYKGSLLGLFWSFLTPLAMLSVFTFVFGVVFKSRWSQETGNHSLPEFAIILFVGQLSFQLFGEPAGRASNLIVSVPNLVKKVVFPLQIIPISIVGAALYHAFIGFLIALAASLFIYGSIPWTALLLPLSLAPLIMLALGATWFLASLGVYIRDVGYAIAVILQMLFFATPIFYPLTAIPEEYRPWMQLNPLCWMIALVRENTISGLGGSIHAWISSLAIGFSCMLVGRAWFMTTKKGFADVL